jgi:hypothetical protein
VGPEFLKIGNRTFRREAIVHTTRDEIYEATVVRTVDGSDTVLRREDAKAMDLFLANNSQDLMKVLNRGAEAL